MRLGPRLLAGLIFVCAVPSVAHAARQAKNVPVSRLGGDVYVLPGVFPPGEADQKVLPFMEANKRLFEGSTVLEIGVGSGVNSVYAVKLGATRIIGTDINKNAIASTKINAKRFEVGSRIEPRLVPESDMSAFSVVPAGETFDVILSNPPFSLNLDYTMNNARTDRGDLGVSLVRGLGDHLSPGGVAVLLYDSLFYHHLIVELARLEGYEVRNHYPVKLTAWEAATLFDSYAAKWAKLQELEPGAFKFDWLRVLGERPLIAEPTKQGPLFPWNDPEKSFPGWIVIQHP